jgi:hypothetical protein
MAHQCKVSNLPKVDQMLSATADSISLLAINKGYYTVTGLLCAGLRFCQYIFYLYTGAYT